MARNFDFLAPAGRESLWATDKRVELLHGKSRYDQIFSGSVWRLQSIFNLAQASTTFEAFGTGITQKVSIFTISNLISFLWLETNRQCLFWPTKFVVRYSTPRTWRPFENYLPVLWNPPSIYQTYQLLLTRTMLCH
jgi:hypothetical protein